MFSANSTTGLGITGSISRLIGTLFILLSLSFSAVAQSSNPIFLQASFSGRSLPTNWKAITSNTTYNWGVSNDVNYTEGNGSALTLVKTTTTDVKNVNVYAFTSGMNMSSGVYTVSFRLRNTADGVGKLNLALNTVQNYTNATSVALARIKIQPAWTLYEFTFTVPTSGVYYLGFGITEFIGAINFAIDEVKITGIKNFYNKTDADITLLANWGANPDGSGVQPAGLSHTEQTFNLVNYTPNATLTLAVNLNVSGTKSKLILGNGLSPVTLQLVDSKSLQGNGIDVTNYATLLVDAKSSPKLGILSPLSTVVFAANAPSDIMEGDVFGSLVFTPGKKNKLTKKIKINGKLDLNGSAMDLGDYDLELGADAAVVNSSASNYLVLSGKGRLRQAIRAGADEVSLPVGNTTYNPVKIKLAAGSQDDVFSVGILDGVYNAYSNDVPDTKTSLTNKTINKTWVISEDVKGGSDISVTLTWSAADALMGFDPANCHVKHYENGVWDADMPIAASLTDGIYSVTRTGITSFSPFTVSSESPTVLPVELLHFAAKATENNLVKLSWATAMEKDNQYFAVERSQDSKTFTKVGEVKGKGTTTNRTDYTFTDNTPLAGTAYYRLRQVDLDGTAKYLLVRSVTLVEAQHLRLSVYPNPAQNTPVNLQVQGLSQNEVVQVLVSDIMGNKVLQKLIQTGLNAAIAPGELKTGTYLIKIVAESGAQTQKLVIR